LNTLIVLVLFSSMVKFNGIFMYTSELISVVILFYSLVTIKVDHHTEALDGRHT